VASLFQICEWLGAEVLAGAGGLDRQVERVCGSDLMSDVLSYSQNGVLLLTGLVNAQVIHTCEVAGIFGVVFVRGKRPLPEVVASAEEFNITLMATRFSMFESCGLLFVRGIKGLNGVGLDDRCLKVIP